jgi:hypothetical protein
MGGTYSTHEVVEKTEDKRLLGRPTIMWKDNIKMDIKETSLWTGFKRSSDDILCTPKGRRILDI